MAGGVFADVRVGMLKPNYTGYGAACGMVRGMVGRGGLSIGLAGISSVVRVIDCGVVAAPTIIMSRMIGVGKRIPARDSIGGLLKVKWAEKLVRGQRGQPSERLPLL